MQQVKVMCGLQYTVYSLLERYKIVVCYIKVFSLDHSRILLVGVNLFYRRETERDGK